MISFDLDMTLLDHNTGKITPSALEAIDILRKKHKIVLATGRDMDNYYSRQYRDIIKPDAVIHMNGTKITVGDNLIFEHLFNRKLLEELLCFCDREGYGIGMTLGDDDYYIHEKNMNGAFHEDTVLMQVLDDHPTSGRRKEGKIIKILDFGFVIPDNLRFDSDIFVSKSQCKNLTSGFKVMVEITDYGDTRR